MIYVSIGMHVENGEAKAPTVKFFIDRGQAERQFHLFCAAAAVSSYETDTAILMTADGVELDRKCWHHTEEPEEPEA